MEPFGTCQECGCDLVEGEERYCNDCLDDMDEFEEDENE